MTASGARIPRSLVASAFLVLGACDIGDYLDGCGDRSAALQREGLRATDTGLVDWEGLALRLPKGFLYRQTAAGLQLFAAPGVYCDSGDWGVVQGGFVQLQVHEPDAPPDPFSRFPDTHRGYAREQINLGVGPFSYSFEQNALTWNVQAYFANVHRPRAIFMYLRSPVALGGARKEIAIHYFPSEHSIPLPELTAGIEIALRR